MRVLGGFDILGDGGVIPGSRLDALGPLGDLAAQRLSRGALANRARLLRLRTLRRSVLSRA